jgi:uncharacterized phage-associated protein
MATIHDVGAAVLYEMNESVSTSKFQRLIFLAQAWSLVLRNKQPLFSEDFVLWSQAPVNLDLFERHKDEFLVKTWTPGNRHALDKSEEIIVNSVVRQYGGLSGPQLTNYLQEQATWNSQLGTGYVLYKQDIYTAFEKTLLKS